MSRENSQKVIKRNGVDCGFTGVALVSSRNSTICMKMDSDGTTTGSGGVSVSDSATAAAVAALPVVT